VHENKDYLRDQQRKMLKRQMEERTGTVKVKKKRNRKKRIGEGEGSSNASTPAEAMVNVMKRRGFSTKINYNAIKDMFEDRQDKLRSREGSVVSSTRSSAGSPPKVAGTGTGKEVAEEEEEREASEDESVHGDELPEDDVAVDEELEAIFT
jgi:transcription factor IIIB subunit 2